MFDVITFGSGTKDTYLILDKDKAKNNQKNICFRYGDKIEADEIRHTSGGGGTNTAAALSKFGFNVAWCGMVGNDEAGLGVMEELKEFGVDTNLTQSTNKRPTNQSVVLMSRGSDRTILTYRGASNEFGLGHIPWEKLNAKWFYIAPLAGENLGFFEPLLEFAQKRGIKTMLNPSAAQIQFILKKGLNLLSKINILSVNEEEALLLAKTREKNAEKLLAKFSKLVKDAVIITKGAKGACASDKKNIYSVGAAPCPVVDRTGAGDSFNAGFLSGFMENQDMTNALQLASAQAACNLQNWGAKFNLLCRADSWEKPNVKIKPICKH